MTEMIEPGWSNAQADCRRVFEENSQPMWVVEALELVDVNRAALLHYGYSRDEFLALTIDALSAESPGPARSRRIRTQLTTSTERRIMHRRGGDLVSRHLRGRPASLASVLDVTYRRRTEAQTRYLDLLLATVNDAVVASDEQFVLTGWNAAAESTYGRRAEEVLGLPDALVFRTDFVGVERTEAVRRLLETGRFQGELTHRRKDGKRIHIESRAAAFFDSDGKRLGYVSVNRDVTERRFAEETIRALLNDVLTAQEAERRRIARELHDDTAQTLTSLLVRLKAVEESKDPGQAMEAAGVLRSLVSGALRGCATNRTGTPPERPRRPWTRGGAGASGTRGEPGPRICGRRALHRAAPASPSRGGRNHALQDGPGSLDEREQARVAQGRQYPHPPKSHRGALGGRG